MKTDTARTLSYRYLPDALEALVRLYWQEMHTWRRVARDLGTQHATGMAERMEQRLRALLVARRSAREIGQAG